MNTQLSNTSSMTAVTETPPDASGNTPELEDVVPLTDLEIRGCGLTSLCCPAIGAALVCMTCISSAQMWHR